MGARRRVRTGPARYLGQRAGRGHDQRISRQKFVARIAQIGDVVDPETHTLTVRFLVNNPQQRLKPGMFATASIELSPAAGAGLTVPSTAVFMEEGKSYSYVQTGSSAFTRRESRRCPTAAAACA